MRERRRMRLAARQLMLAKIARRDAMAALADVVAQENKSAAAAQKSRDLLAIYGAGEAPSDATGLATQARFNRSLCALARQADAVHQDALDQAKWQVENLAKAQARTERFEEHRRQAKRSYDAVLARREAVGGHAAASMARKLHSDDQAARPSGADLSQLPNSSQRSSQTGGQYGGHG